MSKATLRDQISQITTCYCWERFFGAYRSGDWVLDALHQLLNESQTVRNSIYDCVFEEINHQQTHYQLTGPLVVTLIRLCGIGNFPNREQLMNLVAEILEVSNDLSPIVLRKKPVFGLHWQRFDELTWHHIGESYDELITMVENEAGILAWCPARILSIASKRVPVYPLGKPFPRPVFSDSQQRMLDAVLSAPFEFTGFFDEADLDAEVKQTSNTVHGKVIQKASRNDYEFEDQENWLQHCGINAAFVLRIPQMLEEDLLNFEHLLLTNYGWQKNSALVDSLAKVLESVCRESNSNSQNIDRIAVRLLNVIGDAEVLQGRLEKICFEIAQRQPVATYRKEAIKALVKLRQNRNDESEYFERLFELKERDVTVSVLEAIADGELTVCDLTLMLPFFENDDWRIRHAAIRALANRNFELDEQTRSHVYQCYADPDSNVRLAAVCVSIKTDTKHREQLIRCLDDPDEQIRTAALRRIQPKEREISRDMPLLVAALDDPSPSVINEAWRQLAQSNEWKDEESFPDHHTNEEGWPTGKELLKRKQAQFAKASKVRAQIVLDSITDSTSPQSTLFKWQIVRSLSNELDISQASEILDAKMDKMPIWLGATAKHWRGKQ